ncbi:MULTISPECIES: hypothetical protein [Xanthomonas]|uniref:hypothetical protein n=1 Tax=Xanthomonas TaxID=338 RepID=UPI001EDE51C5|nr:MULTISPECIES: hypothetical protein [Xanthomonas]
MEQHLPGAAPQTSKLFAWGKVMLLCAPIIWVPLGLFIDFAPAPFLRLERLFWPMMGVGAVIGVLLHKNARRHGRPSIVDQNSQLVRVFMICVTPPLLGLTCWLLLCKIVPWSITVAVGKSFEQTHVMRTHYQYDRRACEYRLLDGPMAQSVPNYLCISEAFYRRHPEQQVRVVLKGQRSALGMRIEIVDAH